MSDLETVSARNLPDMLEFLLHRRSSKVKNLRLPGPDEASLSSILKAAARVPDHGKLAPWRFIVLAGDGREKAGALLKSAYLTEETDASPAKLDLEAERFLRAPVVIAVVSCLKVGKTPEWEQILSAGAACFNLCLAANAQGFSTTWLTEWYAYNAAFQKAMGLADNERFAGFIYIGTSDSPPEERDRPDLSQIVAWF